MIFHKSVPEIDRKRVKKALGDIKKYGDSFQFATARFIEETEIVVYLGLATKVGGSGSVQLDDPVAARSAVKKGNLSINAAAQYVRLNIARETIDTGGQQGIEGTFVHEGKHARDFARMLSTFSLGEEEKLFNPTAFQREYSAHLSAAFYLMRRGESYVDEGIHLGLLDKRGEKVRVSKEGIRSRLSKNYGLTEATPGARLNECSNPHIKMPSEKWLGIF